MKEDSVLFILELVVGGMKIIPNRGMKINRWNHDITKNMENKILIER